MEGKRGKSSNLSSQVTLTERKGLKRNGKIGGKGPAANRKLGKDGEKWATTPSERRRSKRRREEHERKKRSQDAETGRRRRMRKGRKEGRRKGGKEQE